MKESNRFRSIVGILLLCVGLGSTVLGWSSAPRTQPPLNNHSLGDAQASFLDVIFDGTWGFVQKDDGSIQAFTPYVPDHTPPYFRSLNEGQMQKGSYELKMNAATSGSMNALPPTSLAKLRDYSGAPDTVIWIDPQKHRYVSIAFPRPLTITSMHEDTSCLTSNEIDDKDCTDKLYIGYSTSIALRFGVNDLNNVALHFISPAQNNDMPIAVSSLGSEGIVHISTGPEQADTGHSHARFAFAQLVSMFQPVACFVSFPTGMQIQAPRHGVKIANVSGLDCLAPSIFIDCSNSRLCK
jgi:hypothetical protein